MNDIYLVIGGNGFIGYSVIKELIKRGHRIRCLDICLPEDRFKHSCVEYCIGDVWDKGFLMKALNGITCVMDFISTSMPNTNDISLSNEINNTLRYYDTLLSTMACCGVYRYIFPSSGGAIYGNKEEGLAYETDKLMPLTPYGVGKQMAEDIIRYYYNKCGISSVILRIGNVYGSPRLRSKAQGIIDVFTQNALRNEKIIIWGNAKESIRDYIHLEDVASAIVTVAEIECDNCRTYNVGTGIGTSVAKILEMISNKIGREIQCEYKKTMSSGLNSIILSMEKIRKEVGWEPKIMLDEGIDRTIEVKRNLLGL